MVFSSVFARFPPHRAARTDLPLSPVGLLRNAARALASVASRQDKTNLPPAHRETFPILEYSVPYFGLEVGVLAGQFGRFFAGGDV